jgi:hypothetical protein
VSREVGSVAHQPADFDAIHAAHRPRELRGFAHSEGPTGGGRSKKSEAPVFRGAPCSKYSQLLVSFCETKEIALLHFAAVWPGLTGV